jgi:hypothetical protein
MPGRGAERVPASLFADVPAVHELEREEGASSPAETTAKPSDGESSPKPESSPPTPDEVPPSGDESLPEHEPVGTKDGQPHAHLAASAETLDTVSGRRRPARYGLLVQFESRPSDLELGRLVDSTIWINDAHPAYMRGGIPVARLPHGARGGARVGATAVDVRDEHAFITQFLAHWGGAHAVSRSTGRRRPKKTA